MASRGLQGFDVVVLKSVLLPGRRKPDVYESTVTVMAQPEAAARRAVERAGYIVWRPESAGGCRQVGTAGR